MAERSSWVLFGTILLACWAACSSAEASPSRGSRVFTAAEPQGLFDALGKATHAVRSVGESLELQLGTGADATSKAAKDLHQNLERSADGLAHAGSRVNNVLNLVTDKAADIGHKTITGVSETADKLANLFKREREPADRRLGHESARMVRREMPSAAHHEAPNMHEDRLESGRVHEWEQDSRERAERRHEDSEPFRAEEREVPRRKPGLARDPATGREAAWRERPTHAPRGMRMEAFDHGSHAQHTSRRIPAAAKVGMSYSQARRAAVKQARAEGLLPNPHASKPKRHL